MLNKYMINGLQLEIDEIAIFIFALLAYILIVCCKEKPGSPMFRLLICGSAMSLVDALWILSPVFREPEICEFICFGLYYGLMLLLLGMYVLFVVQEMYPGFNSKLCFFLSRAIPALLTAFYFTAPLFFSIKDGEYLNSLQYSLMDASKYASGVLTVIFTLAVVISSIRSKTNSEKAKVSRDLVAFVVLFCLLAVAQGVLYSDDDRNLAIVLAIGLGFLFVSRSIQTFLRNQANAARMKADLDTAAEIQLESLPTVFPPYANHPEIDLYAEMHPAKYVGGDFYDCFELDEKRVCFVIADVSGKGIPAALFMMKAKTMIVNYASVYHDCTDIFNLVNAALCYNNKEKMFATAWIGILDTETLILQFTNAGHERPYLAHKDGSFEKIPDRHGLFLGGLTTTKYRQTLLQLRPGDSIFLYTDGVKDAHNSRDELFSETRIEETLNSVSSRSGKDLTAEVKKCIDEFAGEVEQFDDITMMMINIGTKTY